MSSRPVAPIADTIASPSKSGMVVRERGGGDAEAEQHAGGEVPQPQPVRPLQQAQAPPPPAPGSGAFIERKAKLPLAL